MVTVQVSGQTVLLVPPLRRRESLDQCRLGIPTSTAVVNVRRLCCVRLRLWGERVGDDCNVLMGSQVDSHIAATCNILQRPEIIPSTVIEIPRIPEGMRNATIFQYRLGQPDYATFYV